MKIEIGNHVLVLNGHDEGAISGQTAIVREINEHGYARVDMDNGQFFQGKFIVHTDYLQIID